ncbi:protein phosphatase 1 regulatory subunit 36 [Megalops cyprinoides]|uniref:protein phosphatase 1 regulatory subunit 36 n=1 Tax=Megalops cyprinoides TaxID=118141 RepID=UPI0018648B13|nr:protein phosphatase 1 regulatory subunit 36 [Megalops cyprinoides]
MMCPKKGNKNCVTIEDIKQATVLLLQEESVPIPLSFLHVMKRPELDTFLASLLLYMSCYFERETLEKKTTPHMMEQSLTELKMLAEARAKVDLSLKQLAIHYSTLLLEVSLPLLSSRRGKASSTNKDRELFECLYSFLCYAAWVTFSRKDLRGIQEEVGRLLYSDIFNPARKIRDKERKAVQAQKEGEKEGKEPPPTAPDESEPARRLDLSKVLTQRTPLMEALLPPVGQAASQLSSTARSQNDPMMQISPKEILLDELNAQLASLSFGILGKPLSQFSGPTLLPQGVESKDEEKEDEEEKDSGNRTQSRKTSDVDKLGGPSRENAVSRATTEGVSSDPE